MTTPAATAEDAPQISEMEMLLDGAFHELKFKIKDAVAEHGVRIETEKILVRKIPVSEMQAFAKAWGKPEAEVAVYLDRKPERVAQLMDESFSTAMSEGRRLNFHFFRKWFQWQAETLKAIGQNQALDAIVEKATNQIVEKYLSQQSSNSLSPKDTASQT